MKTLKPLLVITILSISLNSYRASAQSTGLNATWQRNNGKSDAGGLSVNSLPLTLEISQSTGMITIKGTNKNGQGEITTYTDVLTPDVDSPIERAAGNGQKKACYANGLETKPNSRKVLFIQIKTVRRRKRSIQRSASHLTGTS